MKKTTTYFAVISIIVLIFLGVFVYISATTYSVGQGETIDINDVVMSINSDATISATVSGVDNDNYSILWEIVGEQSSNTINLLSLGVSETSVNNGNSTYENTISSGPFTGSITIRATLKSLNGDNGAFDEAIVTIIDNNVRFKISSPNGETDSVTIESSSSGMQLSVPERYASYNIIWTSSNPSVATVDDNGYVTPRGTGSTIISASGEDALGNSFSDDMNMIIDDNDAQQQGGEIGQIVDYTLSSLMVNDSLVSGFSSNTYNYSAEITGDTFSISATPSTSHFAVTILYNGTTMGDAGHITWNPDNNNKMVFSICVKNSSSSLNSSTFCSDDNIKYNLTITKTSNIDNSENTNNDSGNINNDNSNSGNENDGNEGLLDTYLKNLSIDNNAIDFSCINSNTEGDQFVCNLEYVAPRGTTKIKVDADAIDGYEFLLLFGPGEYNVQTGDNSIILEIAKVGESDPVAFYNIIVTVLEDSNPPDPSSISNNSTHEEGNPGTGEMSSFIIFMIMLMSLVASLFVYTKKVGNN